MWPVTLTQLPLVVVKALREGSQHHLHPYLAPGEKEEMWSPLQSPHSLRVVRGGANGEQDRKALRSRLCVRPEQRPQEPVLRAGGKAKGA